MQVWRNRIRKFIGLIFCGALIGPAFAQNKLPDFNQILSKFKEKVESDSFYIGDNYTHRELETIQGFKDGAVSGEEQKFYQVEKRGPDLYKKLIWKDGTSVGNSSFQKKDDIVSVGANLLSRYDFSFERTEILDGRKCWVFTFRPKPNLSSSAAREIVKNGLAGEAWVAQDTLEFAKLTASLTAETKISLKGLGNLKIQKFNITVSATSIEKHFAVDSVWADYTYSVKVFRFISVFNSKHETKKIKYQNYERRKQ